MGRFCFFADNVKAEVDPVDSVNIGVAGGAVHGAVSWGEASSSRMGAEVFWPAIGFGFYQSHDPAGAVFEVPDKDLSKQVLGEG
jgi:hypothetical protein